MKQRRLQLERLAEAKASAWAQSGGGDFENAFNAKIEAVQSAVQGMLERGQRIASLSQVQRLESVLQAVKDNFDAPVNKHNNKALEISNAANVTEDLKRGAEVVRRIRQRIEEDLKPFQTMRAKDKASYIRRASLPPGDELDSLLKQYQESFNAARSEMQQCLSSEACGPTEMSSAVLAMQEYITNDGFVGDGSETARPCLSKAEKDEAYKLLDTFTKQARRDHDSILRLLEPEGPINNIDESEQELRSHVHRFLDIMRVAMSDKQQRWEKCVEDDMKKFIETDRELFEYGNRVLDHLLDQFDRLSKAALAERAPQTPKDCLALKLALQRLKCRDTKYSEKQLTGLTVELEATLKTSPAISQPAAGSSSGSAAGVSALPMRTLSDKLGSHAQRTERQESVLETEVVRMRGELEGSFDAHADPQPIEPKMYAVALSDEMDALLQSMRLKDDSTLLQDVQALRQTIQTRTQDSFRRFQEAMGAPDRYEAAASEVAYLSYMGKLIDLVNLKADVGIVACQKVTESAVSDIEEHATKILTATKESTAKDIAKSILQLDQLDQLMPTFTDCTGGAIRSLLQRVEQMKRTKGSDALAAELLLLDEVRADALIDQYPRTFALMKIKLIDSKPMVPLEQIVRGLKRRHINVHAANVATGFHHGDTNGASSHLMRRFREFLDSFDGVEGECPFTSHWLQGSGEWLDDSLRSPSAEDGLLTRMLKERGAAKKKTLEKIRIEVEKHATRRTMMGNSQMANIGKAVGDGLKTIGLHQIAQGIDSALLTEANQQAVPKVLACIFAYWALDLFLRFDLADEGANDIPLRKPKATQVLAILCLLGVDRGSKIEVKNALARIPTGEGKSVVLAAIAATLALFGYRVDCVCYSSSLSQRDYDSFKDLFDGLGLSDKINYGTFEQLGEKLVEANHGDVREQVLDHLRGKEHAPPARKKGPPKVLLVDEVDTLLSPSLYGAPYTLTKTISHPTVSALQRAIWRDPEADAYDEQVNAILAVEPPLISEGSKWFLLSAIRQMQVAVLEHRKSPHAAGTQYELSRPEQGEGWIEYKVHDQMLRSDRFNYRYLTNASYLHEALENKAISEEALDDHGLPLYVQCGEFAYSLFPTTRDYDGLQDGTPPVTAFYSFVLGVSGTLDEDSLPPDALNTLADELFIRDLTMLPSSYGECKRDWAPGADVKLVCDKNEHHLEITNEILSKLGTESARAVLVFFESRAELLGFYHSTHCNDFLRSRGKGVVTCLTEVLANDKARGREKDNAIRKATTHGQITLCTRTYGRGVDFRVVDKKVLENKGMHAISTFFCDDVSEEIQFLGRVARMGDEGSFSMILNAESLERFGSENISKDKLDRWVNERKLYANLVELRQRRATLGNDERLQKARSVKNEHQRLISTLHDQKSFGKFVKLNNDVREKVSSRTLILIDVTNSMARWLDIVKMQVSDLFKRTATVLDKQNVIKGFEMQIAGYRNYNAPAEQLLEHSPWSARPEDLVPYLNQLEVGFGWQEEAIEAAFLHLETENKTAPVTQVILIGDRGAQPVDEVQWKRANGYKAEGKIPAKYWEDQRLSWMPEGLGEPKSAEQLIQRMKDAGTTVPVHAYYVDRRAQESFERMANMTGGTSGFLSIDTAGAAENLVGLVCTQILETLGGEEARLQYESLFSRPSFSA